MNTHNDIRTATVTIGGTQYTFAATMGAFLAYRIHAGHSTTKMDGEDPAELATWCYFLAEAGAKLTNTPFTLSLNEWLDGVAVNHLEPMAKAVAEVMQAFEAETETSEEKKT